MKVSGEVHINSIATEICQCCLSTDNLKSMTEPFIVEDKIEMYHDMLSQCFKENLFKRNTDNGCTLAICDGCITRLRLCYNFRRQIERVQKKLQEYSETPVFNETFQEICNNGIKQGFRNVTTEFLCEETTQIENDSELLFESQFDCTKNIKDNDKTLNDEEDSLKHKIKVAISEIKNIKLHDELIPKQHYTCNSVKDFDSHKSDELFESLHKKIVKFLDKSNKLNICTDNSQNSVPIPKNKTKKMSKDEYREKCRVYLKKRRCDLKPYQLCDTDNKCNICNEEFYSYQSLVAHMNGHFPQFICDKCGKGFAVRSALRAHIRTHDDGVPCEICNKKIMKRNLSKHVNAHLGKKDIHRCPFCNERFDKFSGRAIHMEKVHNIVKRYKCKWCDKIFNLAANLNLHIRDQHNAFGRMHIKRQDPVRRKARTASLECPQCGKTFRQKLHLEHHHISKHSNEKNYQCHICLRSYFLKYTLNQHMKDYHLDATKFPCHICNKVFKVKRMVTRHIKRVHNKQYSSPCGVSGEQFNNGDNH